MRTMLRGVVQLMVPVAPRGQAAEQLDAAEVAVHKNMAASLALTAALMAAPTEAAAVDAMLIAGVGLAMSIDMTPEQVRDRILEVFQTDEGLRLVDAVSTAVLSRLMASALGTPTTNGPGGAA